MWKYVEYALTSIHILTACRLTKGTEIDNKYSPVKPTMSALWHVHALCQTMVPSNDEAYSITRCQIRLPFVSLKGVIIDMAGASVYLFQCELHVKIPYTHDKHPHCEPALGQ